MSREPTSRLYICEHPASVQDRIDPGLLSTVLSLLVEITPSAGSHLWSFRTCFTLPVGATGKASATVRWVFLMCL